MPSILNPHFSMKSRYAFLFCSKKTPHTLCTCRSLNALSKRESRIDFVRRAGNQAFQILLFLFSADRLSKPAEVADNFWVVYPRHNLFKVRKFQKAKRNVAHEEFLHWSR